MFKNTWHEEMENILEFERQFYSAFSDVHRGDGYRIFYRPRQPGVTDCNHAFLDLSNGYYRRLDVIEHNLDEIEAFYQDLGGVPRLYQGFYADEFDLLSPILKGRGYTCERFDETRLHVLDRKLFEAGKGLFDTKVGAVLEELEDPLYLDRRLFEDVDGSDEWYGIITELIEHHRMRVFVMREKNRIVAMATADIRGSNCRIDQVRTLTEVRNKGYCFSLTRLMLERMMGEDPNLTFHLYASKPQAIIPYQKNGFKRIDNGLGIWGAWKTDEPIK